MCCYRAKSSKERLSIGTATSSLVEPLAVKPNTGFAASQTCGWCRGQDTATVHRANVQGRRTITQSPSSRGATKSLLHERAGRIWATGSGLALTKRNRVNGRWGGSSCGERRPRGSGAGARSRRASISRGSDVMLTGSQWSRRRLQSEKSTLGRRQGDVLDLILGAEEGSAGDGDLEGEVYSHKKDEVGGVRLGST